MSNSSELQREIARLNGECARLRHELAEMKDLAYNRAPKIAAEEANKQAAELNAEIKRLRDELGFIALAHRDSFTGPGEFRLWAQNRARHALGMKPGELKICKK